MSIQSVGGLLQVFLAQDTSVGTLVSTRIYPVRLPQKALLPAVTYQRVSGIRIGKLLGPASAAEPRYQVDCWAVGWNEALELGRAVRQRLEGFTGFWVDSGSPPTLSVRVAVRFDSEQDLFEEDILGGLCRHSADYFIFHDTIGGQL